MKNTFIAFTALALVACTDAKEARRVLEGAGYTNIEIEGYALFGCGQDDVIHTRFIANGPSGKVISGVVCSGLFFKSSTIRF